MISLNTYPCVSNRTTLRTIRPQSFWGNVVDLLTSGDKALNENKLDLAMSSYQDALKEAPDDKRINKKLAKVYSRKGQYIDAEKNLKIYLESNKEDAEAWIELGEAQRKNAYYGLAKKSYEKALALEPDNDLAKRGVLEADNDFINCFSPQTAYNQKQDYAQKNLQTALNMAVNYLTPAYMQDLADVKIQFGATASMNGTANIAQYQDSIKTITLSETYKYAAPQVLAAYLVHEAVHAKDKDPYTSIQEEQDAYEIATKFWIEHADGVKDPEMDYAAELYKQSPETLKHRVEEIYVLRDPSIAKTSPNHPPRKKKMNFFMPANKKVALQSLNKRYDVIA